MKLRKFMFEQSAMQIGGRIIGVIRMPSDAQIIYVGADPVTRGNLALWAEVPEVVLPTRQEITRQFMIMKDDDKIPAGFVFRTQILSVPLLFCYEYTGDTPLEGDKPKLSKNERKKQETIQ